MKRHALFVAMIAALGACATQPPQNTSLEAAKSAVSQARSSPEVAQYAPLELRRAEEALGAAEATWRQLGPDPQVEHLAYLARQRAAIARETAGTKAAEQAVQMASRERDRLVLQARTHEAEQARAQAAASASEAQRAQSQLSQMTEEQRAARQQQQLQELQAQRAQAQASQMTAEQRAARLQQQLEALQARQTERGVSVALGGVPFESGQATLRPGAERRLQGLAEMLRENPELVATVEGFTDSVGDAARNEELSQRRAQAVRDTLAKLGVDASRVEARGYGEAYPIASNGTAAGRQQNRRVEIVISGRGGALPQGFVGPSDGSRPSERGGQGAVPDGSSRPPAEPPSEPMQEPQ